jgi:hypothetical protein
MITLATIAALSMSSGVNIDQTDRLPTGPAPVLRVAKVDRAGRITVEEPMTWTTVKRDSNGDEMQVTFPYTQITVYEPTEVRIYDVRGRRVDPSMFPGPRDELVPVFVSADGTGVDLLSLRHVKGATMILILPKTTPPPLNSHFKKLFGRDDLRLRRVR